jgi:hypothetical protein
MADPAIFDIPIEKWTKVATSVKRGNILPLKNISSGGYVQTIRDTGNPTPTDGDYTEAKDFDFAGGIISSAVAIDVYVSVTGDVPGEVRVDL